MTSLKVRGVPAAFYDDCLRLELYTGNETIVIFSTKGIAERASFVQRPRWSE